MWWGMLVGVRCFFFFQAKDGIRDIGGTGVQTCALPICGAGARRPLAGRGAGGARRDRAAGPRRRRPPSGAVLAHHAPQIGRASCRERVSISVVAVSLKTKYLLVRSLIAIWCTQPEASCD